MNEILLNNGVKMPMIGYGVFQIQDLVQCEQCVYDAIQAGYRLIDTASVYGNETAVGLAIKRSGIQREDLFITSKLWVQDAGYESAKKAIDLTLENLQTDYIDLYLIHRPFNDYYGAARIVDLMMNNEVKPAVVQVECHPFYQQEDLREFLQENNILMEAWAPFAEGKKHIFQNDVLKTIAQKYEKSVAQVILRWNIQRQIVPLSKTVHTNRMEENLAVFDFELSQEDMHFIASLDENQTLFGKNENPDYAKMINSIKIHEDF